MKICIDCGHYGKYNQSPVLPAYWESEMTWKLGHYLGDELEKLGVTVIQTRDIQSKDLALEVRGKKSSGCDLFLSIHSNATSSASSASTDYPLACCNADNNTVSAELGLLLAKKIGELMGCKQPASIIQIKGSGNIDWYGVLRGAKSVGTNGILLEHGFHTNVKNCEFLLNDKNLQKLAIAESNIIFDYMSNVCKVNDTTIEKSYLIKVNSSDGFVNIRKSPKFIDSDIVGMLYNGNVKYTIIEEKIVNGIKFGKLKSGIGYVALSCCEVV